ncbi:MAG: Wzz/FepE/Etk N-terminal domain-containing protein [Gammaproteobacteria bacterium]
MMLGDYVTILRRRKLQLVIPFLLILAASVTLAFTLPPVYRSEATILIERQEIPEELITTTVTGAVQEHIESLKQQILTSDNLWDIAEEFNLYAGDRRPENRQDIVASMKEDILVGLVDVEAADPEASSRTSVVTVAFTVSFADSRPEVSQDVTARLSELFMQKNREARVVQTTEVTEFLGREAKRLSEDIADYERKLAAFKQKNVNKLPELSSMNMKLYEQTELDLQRVEDQIQAMQTQQMSLQSQLAITEPYKEIITEDGTRLLSDSEKLSVLTAQYLQATSKYSSSHPDVIRLRREIESLEGTSGAGTATDILAKLTVARNGLLEARQNYSESHPDVQRFGREVATLEQALRNKSYERSTGAQEAAVRPDNPAYVSIKIQLDTLRANLRAVQNEQLKLTQRLAEYENRMAQTPIIESEYQSLSRGYENARAKYEEIKGKQLQARLAEQLESGSKGQQFTLVQPAFFPSSPESPNRIGLALLGVVFAFSGGIGSVSLAEYMDRTVHGSKSLVAIFHAPPLAVIPVIDNGGHLLVKGKQRRLPAAASVIAAMFALGFTLAHVHV